MQKLMIPICFVLSMVFILPASNACAGRNDSMKINAALKALQEDKPEEAVALLKHVLEQEKPEVSALIIAGNAYMQLDKNKKALALYQKGVSIYPKDLGLLQNKAIALYYLQDFLPAGDAFKQLAEMQKNKPKATQANEAPAWFKSQYQAAVCYYKSEHYNKALSTMLPLTSEVKNAQSFDAKKLLAHIYVALEQWKSASAQLSTLVKECPEDRSLWLMVANVNLRMNRLTEASSALQVAHSMKAPTRSECVRLAKMYIRADAPLLASKILTESPEKLTASQLDLLAIAYERSGYITKAVEALETALAQEDTTKRHLEYGKLLYRNQLYDKAVEPLNVVCSKTKKKGLPLYLLGQCFLKMNEYKKASTLFAQAKKYRNVRSNAKSALSLIQHIERMQQDSVTG